MTENKGDLISREALIKWIDDSVSQYGYTYSTDMLNMWGLFKDYLINNAPTVPYFTNEQCENAYDEGYEFGIKTQRPQGEWISNNTDENSWINRGRHCSICHYTVEFSENFCPNCGADMRGEEKNDEC